MGLCENPAQRDCPLDLALPTGHHSGFLGLGTHHDIPAVDPAPWPPVPVISRPSETAGGQMVAALYLVPEFHLLVVAQRPLSLPPRAPWDTCQAHCRAPAPSSAGSLSGLLPLALHFPRLLPKAPTAHLQNGETQQIYQPPLRILGHEFSHSRTR